MLTLVASSQPPNSSSKKILLEVYLVVPRMSSIKTFFRNTENTFGSNTGTNSQDIVWFAIRNVDRIDMGNKKMGTCINRAMVGVMDSTDQDLTGCVGHARNVDW